MANFNYCVPVFTPYTADNKVNLDAIPHYLKYLHSAGLSHIFLNGSSGEFYSLSLSERKQLVEAWLRSAAQFNQQAKTAPFRFIVNIGAGSLVDTVDLAENLAQLLGSTNGALDGLVSAISFMAPSYCPVASLAGLVEFSRQVMAVNPALDHLYYHIPMFTNCQVPLGDYLREAGRSLPRLTQVKYTCDDAATLASCQAEFGSRVFFFCGLEVVLAAAVHSMHVPGAILSSLNLVPNLIRRVVQEKSDHSDGNSAQQQLMHIFQLVAGGGSQQSGLMAAFKDIGNALPQLEGKLGSPRLPYMRLSAEERAQLVERFVQANKD